MDVELVYVDGCPNVEVTLGRIVEAARLAGVAVNIVDRLVVSGSEAVAAGMRGSPTVLVGGVDVVATGDGAALSCRLYVSNGRAEGAPDVDGLVSAFRRRREGATGADQRRA